MKQNHVHREGGVREMLAIALPMVVSNACDTVMIFTDRLFMARLDPRLMNAVMGGGLTSFMMMAFFIGLIGFSTALVAQHLGARRKADCSRILTQSVIIAVCAYPLVLAMRPLACRLFEFMGIAADQMAPQTVYLSILLYGVIFSLVRTCLSCFFSGIGRTRVVMAASIVSMLANVSFNYILIYGKFGFPALGIRGAAYGTVLGGMVGLTVLIVAYLSRANRREFSVGASLLWDRVLMRTLVRLGSPAGFEMLLNILAFNAMVMMFHSLGPAVATAATVVFNWDLVSFVPLIGVEIGVTSLVGRFMGAGRPEKAHRAAMSGLTLGLVYSAFIFVLFSFFPGPLVNVFRPAVTDAVFPEAAPIAVFMVRLASLYVLVEAMLCVFIGALRGAGDTLWAMRMSVTLHWLMVAVLALIMRVLKLSPQAGWSAMVLFFLVFSAFVYRRYSRGGWKALRVVEPAAIPADGIQPL